jgi:glycyl-tRNA synthetase
MIANKGPIGKAFKKEAKAIIDLLANMSLEDINKAEASLEASGKFNLTPDIKIAKNLVSVKKATKTVHVEKITPNVVEPSFGIGRIMYAILEHNFRTREGDEQRTFFSLPASIAPLKASVLPLSNNPEFTPLVKQISKSLTEAEVSHKVDDSSGAIGRRYARTDEVAIPYGICVDFDSLKEPYSATVRERDSMLQVRMPVDDIPSVLKALSNDKMTWEGVVAHYPKFEQQEAKK